jgi:uncharacterized membrane protein YqjE
VTQHEEGLRDQFRRGREEATDLREELAGIAADLRQLAQGEVQLAKAEMRESIANLKQSLIFGGVALVAAMLALTWVFLTLMFALDAAMPLWAASLITLAVLLATAGIAGMLLRSRLAGVSVVPKRTVSSVQEDVRWAKDQLRSQPASSSSATR